MKATPLKTVDSHIRLIEPDIERDATLGVQWLEGDIGRNTLRLMGAVDDANRPTTLQNERERVAGFIERDDQLNWMITYDQQIVGTIWVDLKPTEYLKSPSVHLMIGDPTMRGKGIGSSSLQAVIDYLLQTGTEHIYSRYLLENTGSAQLLHSMGFGHDGEPYDDSDGLRFQNMLLQPRDDAK